MYPSFNFVDYFGLGTVSTKFKDSVPFLASRNISVYSLYFCIGVRLNFWNRDKIFM